MCGRFTLSTPTANLAKLFDLDSVPNLEPRYNIAPTQAVLAVRSTREGLGRELALMRWGLIPSWSKDPAIGSSLINARSETVAEKPSFRTAFKRRRCLIPADGFFEWQKQERAKQPYFIGLADRQPFAFAGLWEHWEGADGSVLDTCTILTTTANATIRPLHDRMPVILDPADYTTWLDAATHPDYLFHLLHPYPAEAMITYPVSTLVNNVANDVPACIQPLA